MPNYLREMLSFPGQSIGDDEEEFDLKKLLAQPPPRMPAQRQFTPMQVPQRQQATWTDLLPQLLAGAGDVLTARGGGRSNYMGQVMGAQQGLRDRAFSDALMQAQINEQSKHAEYEDAWRRFAAEQSGQEHKFNRGMKYGEYQLMQDALAKQKADAEKQANFQSFMYGQAADAKLKDVAGPADLEEAMKAATMQVRSPEELKVLQDLGKKKSGEFAAAAARKKRVDDLARQIYMRKATGISDPYGYGHLSILQAAQDEAERIIAAEEAAAKKK